MRHPHLAALAAAIFMGGCAAPEPPFTANELANFEPVVCNTPARCTALWQRAQLWVVNFADFKIQINTDVVIQTFNPPEHSVRSGITITREPLGGDKYRINFRAQCPNQFGCRPGEMRLRARFNEYLRETPQ